MIFVDTSFLIDFLNGERDRHDDAKAYMDEHVADEVIGIPTPVLYELYREAAVVDGEAGIEQMTLSLQFAEIIDQTPQAAAEAAHIYAEQREQGEMINQADIVIAGIVREYGGPIVTGNDDFDAIAGLTVEQY